MPKFSQKSLEKLLSCHEDLQIFAFEIIKDEDCTILSGHRTPAEQFELYRQGRILKNGLWVITAPSKVVTYKDGVEKKSEHNYYPSMAVDILKYPIDWNDFKRNIDFGNYAMAKANYLFNEGKIKHQIEWGGNWPMKDLVHFQIKKEGV